MTFKINTEAPPTAEIERAFRQAEREAEAALQRILEDTTAGIVAVLVKQYQRKIYQAPMGAFGYPRGVPRLAQAVDFEVGKGESEVFTSLAHAGYKEFGTGIFSTIGARKRITPKGGAQALAFPAWQLPPGFKGLFIKREDVEGNLPPGAIGLVLAKSLRGIQPTPVWFSAETEQLIDKIADAALKREIG